MSSRGLGAAGTAGLLLGLLLWSLVLPLASVALAHDDSGAACCRRGYCCCREPGEEPAGPCLRSRCGCGLGQEAAVAAPLRVEAVLPQLAALTTTRPSRLPAPRQHPTPLARPDAPPVPPPKPLTFA